MKYIIISAYCPDKFWDAKSQEKINEALSLASGNYIEIAPTIWVFKTVEGYSGHTMLAEFLSRQNRTFVQLFSDLPPCVSVSPAILGKFQEFLNS